jgi:hypothetical protein
MKNSFKKQLWISVGVIVGALVVASLGLYILSNDIAGQTQKIVNDKTEAAQQAAVLGILAQLKSDAPVAATYTAAMNKLVPTHDDLIEVPGWLNTLAANHNVSISFSFQGGNAPASESSFGTDGFTLSVEGAPSDIAAFLADMETNSPKFLLSVTSFNLMSNGSGYSLSVQGVFYSRMTQPSS